MVSKNLSDPDETAIFPLLSDAQTKEMYKTNYTRIYSSSVKVSRLAV